MPDPRFTQEHLSLLQRLEQFFERSAQTAAKESAQELPDDDKPKPETPVVN
jgi:hypothetical protein